MSFRSCTCRLCNGIKSIEYVLACRHKGALDKYLREFNLTFVKAERTGSGSSSSMSPPTRWLYTQFNCPQSQFLDLVWKYFNDRLDMADPGDPFIDDAVESDA